MKKFFAVFLVVVLVAFTSVVGFSYETIEPQGVLLQFESGDRDYSLPVDFSNLSDFHKEKFLSKDYQLCFFFSSSAQYGYFLNFSLYSAHKDLVIYPRESSFSANGDFWDVSFTYDSNKNCYVYNDDSFRAHVGPSTVLRFGAAPYFSTFIPNISFTPSSSFRFLNVNSVSIYDVNASLEKLITINYQYSNGTPAADPVTQSLAPGTEYSIPSPEIAGYTPDIPLVTGIMPEEDLTVTVTYAKAFYPLTVQYQYTDGSQAAESVSFQYPLGFVYDIPSPEIKGYQPDKPTIAGEMPGEALEEVVTYSAIPYTLTVQYLFTDGSQAAPDHQEQLTIGSIYSVPSPVIEGYHPNQTAVTGIMPASDVVSTVTYREDSGDSSGPGSSGPGEGGDSGGGDPGGGDGSGDDPFIPALPPFSGNDPFVIPGLPDFSGYDPFVIQPLPPFSGYDPFAISGKGGS